MVIDPKDARLFIPGYTQLLGEVHRLSGSEPRVELLDMLAGARDAIVAEPSLVDAAASILEAAGLALPVLAQSALPAASPADRAEARDIFKQVATLGLPARHNKVLGLY